MKTRLYTMAAVIIIGLLIACAQKTPPQAPAAIPEQQAPVQPIVQEPSEPVAPPPAKPIENKPITTLPPEAKPIETPVENKPAETKTSNFVTIKYKLEAGPNLIPVGLFTSLSSKDLLQKASCNATELHSNIINIDKFIYSPTDRVVHTLSSEPISITAHEIYLLWCKDSGELTIDGIPAKEKPLRFDGNYIVTNTEVNGDELKSQITCNPTLMLKDFAEIKDGTIYRVSGDKFNPETNDGKRWNVKPNTIVMIRCSHDGTYKVP